MYGLMAAVGILFKSGAARAGDAEAQKAVDGAREGFGAALGAYEAALAEHDFLGGERPCHGDGFVAFMLPTILQLLSTDEFGVPGAGLSWTEVFGAAPLRNREMRTALPDSGARYPHLRSYMVRMSGRACFVHARTPPLVILMAVLGKFSSKFGLPVPAHLLPLLDDVKAFASPVLAPSFDAGTPASGGGEGGGADAPSKATKAAGEQPGTHSSAQQQQEEQRQQQQQQEEQQQQQPKAVVRTKTASSHSQKSAVAHGQVEGQLNGPGQDTISLDDPHAMV